MSNYKFKNTPINLLEETNTEDLDLDRINYIGSLPPEELNKACKLSCIENNIGNGISEMSIKNGENEEKEIQETSTFDLSPKDEDIIIPDSYKSPSPSPSPSPPLPSSPLLSSSSSTSSSTPIAPVYKRTLRKRRAIQLQPFTMERKMYKDSLGLYNRLKSKPTGSRIFGSNITKKMDKKKQRQKNQQGSFDIESSLFVDDDDYDQYHRNQDYSSDSSYNDDIDNTNMELSDDEDDDDDDDDDDTVISTKNIHEKKKQHQNNDSDHVSDIDEILNEITKSITTMNYSNYSSFTSSKNNNTNNNSNSKNRTNKTQSNTGLNNDVNDDTDIEDILDIREIPASPINSSSNINNKNNQLSNDSDEDDEDDDNIVHRSKRRRVITIIDSDDEGDTDNDNDNDDNNNNNNQNQNHGPKIQNNNKNVSSHDIFDISQFGKSENQLYIPNRHLHNKNLVTYKSSHNKTKYGKQAHKQKQKMEDKTNKKNEDRDIFEFPSNDTLETNGSNNDESNIPKHHLKKRLSNHSLTSSSSSSMLPSTSYYTPISHLQLANRARNNKKDDDDGFIVYEENEPSGRKRNKSIRDIREDRRSLHGILPQSFTTVYGSELTDEEKEKYKNKNNNNGDNADSTSNDKSDSNSNSKKKNRPFYITHDDNESNDKNNGINGYNSNAQRSTITNKVSADFFDFYQDGDNDSSNSNNNDHYNDNNILSSTSSQNTSSLSLKQPKKRNNSTTTTHQQHMDICNDDDPITLTNEGNIEKNLLYSPDKYKVPILSIGSIIGDEMKYFSNSNYKMFQDNSNNNSNNNNNNGDPIQYLSKNEMVFDKQVTSNDYTVKSSMITSLFYQAFQSFYMIWNNKENDNNGSDKQNPTKPIFDFLNTKTMQNFTSFLQFITKCFIGYDSDGDDDNNEKEKMFFFICKEIDILLSRIFMLAHWNDDNKKPSTANVCEKITQRKNGLNQTQEYLFLVILLFRMEWAIQLNNFKTTMNGMNDLTNEFSILSSPRSAAQSLLWHLFSMDVSPSFIIKKPTSSIIQVANPIAMEAWILLLNFIQKEKLESLLWLTLHRYADYAFRLENDKNSPSKQDILSICEKADFTWFWLLTILIIIRLKRNSDGIYILKKHDDSNLKLQPWNLIYPILKDYKSCKSNCIYLNQHQLLHTLKAIRNSFYQCYFLISNYNWQWDNKLAELLHILIEWQSVQLYKGSEEEEQDNHYSSNVHYLSSHFTEIDTDTGAGYFPSFLLNYNGHIPDHIIKPTDHSGMIFLKIISFGLSKQVSLVIDRSATLSLNEKEKILERLKKYISRITSSYSIVTGASNTSSSEILHQMVSKNKSNQHQQLSYLDPNHEDSLISFAFNYTINSIILHCICRLYIHDITQSVINRSISIQSKVHTDAAWASEIKVAALSIYQKIEKYWQLHQQT